MTQGCPTRQKIRSGRNGFSPPFQNLAFPDCHIIQQPRLLGETLERAAATYVSHGPELFLSRGTVEILETELQKQLPPDTRPLLDDALALARRYRQLSGTAEIRFRLEKITTDSCRRFHMDNVPLRLLCAYAGPGVQWKQVDDGILHETPTGCVTLLKGLQFPGRSEKGAVLHRSPPLSSLAIPVTRLLLTLDHPDACGMGPGKRR